MKEDGSLVKDQTTKVYTVSALNAEIRQLLEAKFEFVWVEGEISNFRVPSSGHYYMVLKDDKAQIRAVMFRPQARIMKFMPEDGMKVVAQGRVTVYEPRGEYQIILDYLEPLGVGALALAFEQLKKKLAAQGLFDQAIKRPLPFLPQRVAVITSPTGAAIRDFLKIVKRRFANIGIIVVPVKVQGDEAAAEIVEALDLVNRELDVDVIVITRGGGSLEDLWAFNHEELALAIRASRIPVVSAVGHEIDWTICDMAADLRAPTPSAAAELLVVEKESLRDRITQFESRIRSSIRAALGNLNQRLLLLSKGLRDPRRRLADFWMRLDDLSHRLLKLIDQAVRLRKRELGVEGRSLMRHSPLDRIGGLRERIDFQRRSIGFLAERRIKEHRMALSLLQAKVKDMNPLSILERGYAVARKLPEKWILKSASQVRAGDRVSLRLAEGALECLVEKVSSEG